MKRRLWMLALIAAVVPVSVAGYWGSEYWLVSRYVKHQVAAAEHAPASTVKIVGVQLLGDRPWSLLFRPHYWTVLYQDARFRALDFPKETGNILHVDELHFGQFASYQVRPSREMLDDVAPVRKNQMPEV